MNIEKSSGRPSWTRTLALALSLGAALTTPVGAQDQETGEVELDPPTPAPARETEPAPLARDADAEQTQPRRESDARAADTSPENSLEQPGPLRLYGGFSVAIGGHPKYDGRRADVRLDPTVGIQGGADYLLFPFFAIGGEMRFLFPKVDGQDRFFLWDLVVKPSGRYMLDQWPIEVFGALPFGMTVAGIDGDQEGKVGFNFGLVGGATYFLSEKLGVSAEMGWTFHRFGIEQPVLFASEIEYKAKMNQFLFLCPNFVYVL